ncbi:hypothetical protein [Chthonomonas calidirosea]|uniref:hypothetical protein n=1 Tax=Chthonomonas calidirosea TaxID=454171 RepID=UPI0006ECC678|nr:hypothetical protein [Chthonomonas calidirosea]CEK15413.1 hypothetical protein CP488_01160 [Chthonomonas calidirosea]
MTYSPPGRGTNPLVYILAACGGCVILVVIGIFGLGLFVTHKFAGAIKQMTVISQFGEALRQQNYEKAASFLTGSAQQQYSANTLRQKIEGLEKEYGALESFTLDPQQFYRQNQNPSQAPNTYQLSDYLCDLQFQRALVHMKLHFDPSDPRHISGLTWGSVYRNASETSPSEGAKKHTP